MPFCNAISNLASLKIDEKLIATFPIAVRAADDRGWTPLHVASSLSHSSDVVKVMLDAFPTAITLRTNKGKTPVTLAQENEANEKDLILQHLVMEENKFGDLPLFEKMRKAEMVDALWVKQYSDDPGLNIGDMFPRSYKPRGAFV